jgi:magnesium transporter
VLAREHLARRFAARHPQRSALALADVSPAEAAAFLESLDPRSAVSVLGSCAPATSMAITQHLEASSLAVFVGQMTSPAGVALLRALEAPKRKATLAALPKEVAAALAGPLRAPHGSLGAMAEPVHALLSPSMSVGDARDVLRDTPLAYGYVVEEERRLVGVVHRRELRLDRVSATVSSLMSSSVVRLPASASPWALNEHPAWKDFDVLPVVDEKGVMVGILRHRNLRRLRAESPDSPLLASPAMNTFLELGELYWEGLTSMLTTMEARSPRRKRKR